MTKILPPRTIPPSVPTKRRHSPPKSESYRDYRKCLRWEFGFSCAFCLLHGLDFVRGGRPEGSGLTWVEHLTPQSESEELRGVYTNCVYSCRYCNKARSDKPILRGSSRLLDPTKDAWGKYFELKNDKLELKQNSRNANYTLDAYDLNDPRKVEHRECRRKSIAEQVHLIKRGPRLVGLLLGKAETGNPNEKRLYLDSAKALQLAVRAALRDLGESPVVPKDAPRDCRCGDGSNHKIPEWLGE